MHVDRVSFRLLSLEVISRADDEEDSCRSTLSTCLCQHHLCSSLRSLCIGNMPFSVFLPPRREEEEEEEKALFNPHLPLLKELIIIECSDMRRLPVETLLCRLPRLTCLGIFHCPELTLPSLEEALRSLPSLEQLYVRSCPKLTLPVSSVPKYVNNAETPMGTTHPPSSSSPPTSCSTPSSSPLPLRGLFTDDVGLLASRQFVRDHLSALQTVVISSDHIESFTVEEREEWPRSLRRLTFLFCPNLRELPPDLCTLFPSLVSLDIRNCPNLRCMPERGLPLSLKFLDIESCPKLEMDWPSLAYVRLILKDGKIIQGSSLADYCELIANGNMVRLPY